MTLRIRYLSRGYTHPFAHRQLVRGVGVRRAGDWIVAINIEGIILRLPAERAIGWAHCGRDQYTDRSYTRAA
jgi:hypothetical protein